MNTIYRIIWNAATGKWIVASEIAKGRKKRALTRASALSLIIAGILTSANVELGATEIRGEDSEVPPHAVILVSNTAEDVAENYDQDPISAAPNSAVSALGESVAEPFDEPVTMADYFKANGANDGSDNAVASGARSIAVGANALSGEEAIAIGSGATARSYTVAGSRGGVAVGTNALAAGAGSVVVGHSAETTDSYGVAVGTDAVSNRGGVSVGYGSQATGTYGVAIGRGAMATENGSIAFGYGSQATAAYGAAIGRGAVATESESMALGHNARASNTGAISFGASSVASGRASIATGLGSSAEGDYSAAVGRGAQAGGLESLAFGRGSSASNASSVAISTGATAAGRTSVALGYSANAAGDYTLALGRSATASATGSVALGRYAVASEANAVALGQNSIADRSDSVSVGRTGAERQITFVKAGTSDTDAVNLLQLKSAETSLRADLTQISESLEGMVVHDDVDMGSVTFGGADGTVLKNVADGEVSEDSREAINGSQLHATHQQIEQNTTAITNIDGRVTAIEGEINNGGIGLVRQDADSRDIAIAAATDGTRITVAGTAGDRVVSGVAAGTADTDAVNVSQLKAAGLIGEDGGARTAVVFDSDVRDSITLGGKDAAQAVKIKNVADATEDDEAVNLRQLKDAGLIGEGGRTLDAVAYDESSNRSQVTFAGANGTLLTNVADGRIAAGSRDAVNGGQIAALRDQLQGQISNIDNRVTHIEQNGGGTGDGGNPYFDANGKPTPDAPGNGGSVPSLPPGGAQADGASAVAAGDGAVASGNASVAVGAGAKAEADNAVALGAGSVADREGTVSVGREGGERQITHVKAGVRDTDAVNVAQLNQRIAEANAYTDQRIDDVWQGVNDRIDHASRQANRGIASASAMIPVTPYLPGKTVLNAGMATYRGETALGVGVSRWSDNGRVNFNAGVSAAQGDSPIFRVGVGVVLGD